MKHITILALPDSNMGSVDNPRRGFLAANEFLRRNGEAPLFKIQLAGIKKEVMMSNGLFTIHADTTIDKIKKTDLIIIPALEDNIPDAVARSSGFIPWIIKQYHKGAEVASLCVGAFILASTGLLNGKNCSTHWRAAHDFRKMFPAVELITEKVITDENSLYTSGGAFSSANLILYLIEKFAGRETAIHCSKIFQIDFDRQTQSPFIIFQGQKDHHDDQVKQAQEFIENNFSEKISVDQLTSIVALSRRNLERRFKKATTNTVIEYIQRVKIEAAKKFFESSSRNISEVMYDVGYSDNKAFRNVFRKITGLSPVEYKSKYNKDVFVY
jgi:transcriptional regulator GlxA family with amidase domain